MNKVRPTGKPIRLRQHLLRLRSVPMATLGFVPLALAASARGFMAGGIAGNFVSSPSSNTIDRFVLDGESASTISATLQVVRQHGGSAARSKYTGFMLGGLGNSGVQLTVIEALRYPTESCAPLAATL